MVTSTVSFLLASSLVLSSILWSANDVELGGMLKFAAKMICLLPALLEILEEKRHVNGH